MVGRCIHRRRLAGARFPVSAMLLFFGTVGSALQGAASPAPVSQIQDQVQGKIVAAVPPATRVGLFLGGRLAVRSLPAVSDSADEVYSPALDAINGAFGSSLNYDADRNMVVGAAADGTPVSLFVAASAQDAVTAHTAYVSSGLVYVPLHVLSRLLGCSFEWSRRTDHVSLMPRLTSVSIVPEQHCARVELHSSAPLGFVKVSYYDSPWRIVLDVNGARAWPGMQRSILPGLTEVRWKEYPSPGHVRIVIELSSRQTFHIADSGHPYDYWLDIDTLPEKGFPAATPGSQDSEAISGSSQPEVVQPAAVMPVAPAPAAATAPAAASATASEVLPPAPVNVIDVTNSAGSETASGASRAPAPALSAYIPEISGIQSKRVDARTTEVTIHANGPIDCHPSFFDSPSRLVLDIPNSTLSVGTADLPVGGPGVTQVRTGAFPKGTSNSRVVLDLTSRSLFRVWSEQDRSLVRVLVQEMQPNGAGGLTGSPVAGHVVCIDPGHCDVYHGARGLFGLREEDVTLDVAQRLEQLLTAAGAQVIMTRTDRSPCSSGAGLTNDLIQRAMKGNRAHADVFLSIHCNAMPDGLHGSVRGSQVIYSHRQSVPWANIVYRSLTGTLGHGGDGLHYRPHIKVTEYSEMPATLAELGFLDNRTDAELLVDPNFRQREAEGLFHAFETYFAENGSQPRQPPPGQPQPLEPAPLPTPGASIPGTVPVSEPGETEPGPTAAAPVPAPGVPVASAETGRGGSASVR